jgi:hypothetical protein
MMEAVLASWPIAKVRDNAIQASTVILALLWAIGLVVYTHAMSNNDVAWLLAGTEKWIGGGKLYRNIIELNPPLVFYVNLPPVLLAKLTGIPATTLLVFYAFALIGLCLFLVDRLTRLVVESAVGRQILLFASFTAIVVFPARDFGQREHLLLILCLPYMFLAACRALETRVNPRLAGLIGALAGVGFAFKPQFLLVPLLLEVYLAMRLRSRWSIQRPEFMLWILITAVYGASIPLLTPHYITRIVPYAVLVYGKGYENSIFFVFMTWQLLVLPNIILGHCLSRSRQKLPPFADIFLIAAMTFLCIYLSQLKGWSYQVLPVSSLLFMAVAAVIATEGRPAFGYMALGMMLIAPFTTGTYSNPVTKLLAPHLEGLASGKPLYVFSSHLSTGFPLADMVGARWASRFSCMWLLPGAEQGLAAARAD